MVRSGSSFTNRKEQAELTKFFTPPHIGQPLKLSGSIEQIADYRESGGTRRQRQFFAAAAQADDHENHGD